MADYLEHNREALENAGIPSEAGRLADVLKRYPWFTTACILSHAAGAPQDPVLALYMQFHPAPAPMLYEIAFGESPDDMIDNFLNLGEYRIVPDDSATDEDAAAQSSRLEISDDMATEQLAEIYMSHGMEKEAKEIRKILKKAKKDKK